MFKVSNACSTNVWNNITEENVGAGGVKRHSKKGFENDEKTKHARSVEGVFAVSDSTSRPYFTRTGQNEGRPDHTLTYKT